MLNPLLHVRRRIRQVAGQVDAAGGSHRSLHRRAGLRQIARIHDVRVRRDDEHRAVDDEWRGFLAAQNARGERPRWTETGDICRRDFLQTAVAGIRVVFGGHQPLAVVGR